MLLLPETVSEVIIV